MTACSGWTTTLRSARHASLTAWLRVCASAASTAAVFQSLFGTRYIAVAGDSAGGNLAGAIARMSRDLHAPDLLCHIMGSAAIDVNTLGAFAFVALVPARANVGLLTTCAARRQARGVQTALAAQAWHGSQQLQFQITRCLRSWKSFGMSTRASRKTARIRARAVFLLFALRANRFVLARSAATIR